MTKLINWLKGKKTYLIQAAVFIYAISGLVTGNLDSKTAFELIYTSSTVSALRSALK